MLAGQIAGSTVTGGSGGDQPESSRWGLTSPATGLRAAACGGLAALRHVVRPRPQPETVADEPLALSHKAQILDNRSVSATSSTALRRSRR